MSGKFDSIHNLARSQWSLVTRQQLLDAGFDRGQAAELLRAGTLRPVRPDVYATFGSQPSWQQGVLASVLTVGEGALASHGASARLWDWVHLPEDWVGVLVKADYTPRLRGARRTTILPDDDITTRQGIPCTSFERTLCDCSTLLTAFQLGRVLDDGLRRGFASLKQLERCAVRLDSGRGRRLRLIKELLAERDETFHPGGSASELDLLGVIREAGLPAPVQQFHIRAGGRAYDLDFVWPDRKVFAEYYGLAVHSGASAVAHDSRRMSALVALGWRGLVFDETTPDRVIVEQLTKVLSASPSNGDADQRKTA
jgi:hypothetical protein